MKPPVRTGTGKFSATTSKSAFKAPTTIGYNSMLARDGPAAPAPATAATVSWKVEGRRRSTFGDACSGKGKRNRL